MAYKILLADDEESVRNYFGRALEEEGFSVVFARDGDEALSALKSKNVDLAVLDVNMPGRDGFSVLKWLRQEDKNGLPVIILSGLGELNRISKATI